jgi:hypothetical protein
MTAARNMTQFTLNALKGWPAPAAVDFHTTFDDTIVDEVLPGTVVHISSTGTYLLGVGALAVMPLFMFNGSLDPDVINETGDPSTDRGVFIPINPTGQAMALVAVGAYELVSTAFVDDTYAPNDHLTSTVAPAVDAGLLKKGTKYVDTICGVVSRGLVDNGYGFEALAFWPYYLPAE